MTDVYQEITEERKRQDSLWCEQNHSPLMWNAILAEEVGEASREVCESVWCKTDADEAIHLQNLRTEMIQVAAVAVAFVESLDRNELA